jgi:alpha-beta hydrolase superfamily lysophospholipase
MTVASAVQPASAQPPSVEHVSAKDGTSLLMRHWPATTGAPWASVLIVHGLAEHSGRYEHVGAQFAGAGIDTHAFDQRGFGGSGGKRAWIERWSQIHDDLEERLVAIRAIAPARPLVLYGHSLGGLIALGYVLDARALPDLLVLSAPAIEANLPLLPRLAVGVLQRVAPNTMLKNPFDGEVLSRDPDVGRKYVDDPLNQHRTTARFAHAALGEQRRVSAALDRLSIRTLVVHGGKDTLIPTASSEVCEGLPGVARKVYPELRHEVHNEPEGPAVVDEIVAWIRERVSRQHVPVAS